MCGTSLIQSFKPQEVRFSSPICLIPYQVVSEPSIFGPAALNTMAEGTRSADVRREMDGLRDQLRVNSERTERTEKSIEDIKNMMATLAAAIQGNNGAETQGRGFNADNGGESHGQRGQGSWHTTYQAPTRFSQVEFPKFRGEDLRGWVYRCEQFFEVDDTPPDAKVRIAAVHLEGKALQWHQIFMKSRLTRELPNWEDYVRALNERFGALLYEDPMSELVNLKQNGTIQDYLDKFDELVNCVELSEQYAVHQTENTDGILYVLTTVTTDLLQKIKEGWDKDSNIQKIITKLKDDPASKPKYDWTDNVLTRKGKLVVPSDNDIKQAILSYYHSSAMGGHSGIKRTIHRIKQTLYWRGLKMDVCESDSLSEMAILKAVDD
ncbi:hypothetical protein BUALT_Bualt02G0051800 [Buddleja alternifolia]|uniref:Retrotransposon gag domain-containing protein n=1 Tax=Buddleja alternifolia TaxID=168488 RepID=A0AAV6Y8H3_9LAMI|nr:hypothetical protein BUALT_Bualt02G0051800 [Buddleja alternifolia]